MHSIHRRDSKFILLLFLLAALFSSAGTFDHVRAESDVSAFFSQGKAVFDPQDSAQSREHAIQDFQVQAVGQAVSALLSPSEMAGELRSLQEKVFRHPERYVNDYHLFSESSAEGLYRVAGQVSISMELLKKDLIQHGILAQMQPEDSLSAGVSELKEISAGTDVDLKDAHESEEPARGLVVSKPEVLWTVVENWEGEWRFPNDLRDRFSLVASSVAQEVQDFNWSLRLAPPNELDVNEQGNVSLTQAVNLAKKLGVWNVVAGTIVRTPGEGEPGSLAAHLRLVDVSSGRIRGEVRKEVSLDDESFHEAAIEMASVMVPELDSLLKQPVVAVDVPKSVAPMVEESGEWTLRIRSNQQIVYWEAIDRILKNRFKSVQVKSLEFGGDEGVIRLTGIDGSALESLNGTLLPGGVQIQASGVRSQSNTLMVTFIRTE